MRSAAGAGRGEPTSSAADESLTYAPLEGDEVGEADRDDGGASRSRWGVALGVFGALAVIIGTVVAVGAVRAGHVERRNVLVIMTDDQTLESMRAMTHTRKWLGEGGTTFDQYYASFPLCCPSRATYYSGRYAHNTGVQDNIPPFGGAKRFVPMQNDSLAVWLHEAGYRTASVGKYLNTWGQNGDIAAPPGWSKWFGLIDPTTYQYFGYSVSVDGQRRDYGTAPEDYQTDVLGKEVVDTIKARANEDQPWFISFTPLSPHAEKRETPQDEQVQNNDQFRWAFAKPAPRHESSLLAKMPKPASFGVVDDKKPPVIQSQPALGPGMLLNMEKGYQLELQTLQATDEWVGKIVDALRETGQLDDTVLLFTSDNGLFHGEHRLAFVKFFLYEPAVHLPLIMRGPGIPRNKKVQQVAVNADLTPTILSLTGATASGVAMDGMDLLPTIDPKARTADRAVLLENRSNKMSQKAVHTGRYIYIETDGGTWRELYDLEKDPDQLRNIVDDPSAASLVAQLAQRLEKLKSCSGTACIDLGGSG